MRSMKMGLEVDWLSRNAEITVIYNNTNGDIKEVFDWNDVMNFCKENKIEFRGYFDDED